MTHPPGRVIAIVAAVAAGIHAFAVVLRLAEFHDAPTALGHGDEGELLAFECDANPAAQPAVTVHFDTLKEKVTARCVCAALTDLMQSLEDCCNNQPAAKETACDDRTSFGINCSGSDDELVMCIGGPPPPHPRTD